MLTIIWKCVQYGQHITVCILPIQIKNSMEIFRNTQVPGQGTKTQQAMLHSQKKKEKDDDYEFNIIIPLHFNII